jgi:hypothetical protein
MELKNEVQQESNPFAWVLKVARFADVVVLLAADDRINVPWMHLSWAPLRASIS